MFCWRLDSLINDIIIDIYTSYFTTLDNSFLSHQGKMTLPEQFAVISSFISPHNNTGMSRHQNVIICDAGVPFGVNFKSASPSCNTVRLAVVTANIMSVWEPISWLVVSKTQVQKCSKRDKNSLQAICEHLENGIEHHLVSKESTDTLAFQKSIHAPGKITLFCSISATLTCPIWEPIDQI